MYADPADGFPVVGTHRRSLLGVRPTGANADIDLNPPLDPNGEVVVNCKGLSASADWRQLPGHLIPEELDDGFNGASGKGMKVFVHGDGPFGSGAIAAGLEVILKPNRLDSGVVCPTLSVPLAQYLSDLQATRSHWVEDPS